MKQSTTLTSLVDDYLTTEIATLTSLLTGDVQTVHFLGVARSRPSQNDELSIAARLDRLDKQAAAILGSVREMQAHVSGQRRPLWGGRR